MKAKVQSIASLPEQCQSLAAYSLGLGSCYMNQPHWVTDKEATRQAMIGFGMHEDEQIYGGLIVGYAMSTTDAMPARKEGRVCILQN